jgi:hypothetical protein
VYAPIVAAMQRYVRIDPPGEEPERLLDPEEQRSEPWSGTVFGRCDKCGGSGSTTHECESCKQRRDAGCPVCRGEIRYHDECPACEGSGEVDDSCRDGVSVFPDEDGLYRYMIKRDADLDGCVLVELEGEQSPDEDFDADEGALLVRPTKIVDTRPLDRDRIEALRRQVGT